MTDETREELISAYLDDELSADERAQVERLLAEEAEYRQLYEDLRALRATLQALPRHKLDHDLTPGVLRRAERTVLGGLEPRNPDGNPAPAEVVPGHSWRRLWSDGRGWRRVMWPAIAVAAAIMIALFDTDRQPVVREVAQTHATRGESSIEAAKDQPLGGAAASSSVAKKESTEVAVPLKSADARDQAGTMSVKNAIPPAQPAMRALPAAAAAADAATSGPLSPATSPTGGRQQSQQAFRLKSQAPIDQIPVAVEGEVLPRFVMNRALEPILDRRQVAWQRGAEVDEVLRKRKDFDEKPNEQKVQAPPADDPNLLLDWYVVEATPDQIKQIAIDLVNDKGNVLRVTEPLEREAFLKADKNAKPELSVQSLQQFKILLRSSQAPGQKAPAEPAAAPPAKP